MGREIYKEMGKRAKCDQNSIYKFLKEVTTPFLKNVLESCAKSVQTHSVFQDNITVDMFRSFGTHCVEWFYLNCFSGD